MIFEIVMFFQKIPVFEGIPGIVLSNLADITNEVHLEAGQTLSIDDKFNDSFYIVQKGTIDYHFQGKYRQQFLPGQFIGEMLSPHGFVNANLILPKEPTVLMSIEKDLFYELLSDNVKLADKILEFI
jgi:CRP-like cAMP-binding protein